MQIIIPKILQATARNIDYSCFVSRGKIEIHQSEIFVKVYWAMAIKICQVEFFTTDIISVFSRPVSNRGRVVQFVGCLSADSYKKFQNFVGFQKFHNQNVFQVILGNFISVLLHLILNFSLG